VKRKVARDFGLVVVVVVGGRWSVVGGGWWVAVLVGCTFGGLQFWWVVVVVGCSCGGLWLWLWVEGCNLAVVKRECGVWAGPKRLTEFLQ
jgi:hypothetical protein